MIPDVFDNFSHIPENFEINQLKEINTSFEHRISHHLMGIDEEIVNKMLGIVNANLLKKTTVDQNTVQMWKFLKLYDEYTSKQLSFFELFLIFLRIKKHKKTDVKKTISETQKKLDRFIEVKKNTVSCFSLEDKNFLIVFNKLFNESKLKKGKKEEILSESEIVIYDNYLLSIKNNTNEKDKLINSIKKIRENTEFNFGDIIKSSFEFLDLDSFDAFEKLLSENILIEKHANVFLSKITEKDRDFLNVFNKIISGKKIIDLNKDEQGIFSSYLKSSFLKDFFNRFSDLPLNPIVKEHILKDLKISGFNFIDLKYFFGFVEFFNKEDLINLNLRFRKNFESFKHGFSTEEKYKLSLREFSLLDRLPINVYNKHLLNSFVNYNLNFLKNEFNSLNELIKLREKIKKEINNELEKPNALPAGSLLFHDIHKNYFIHKKKQLDFYGRVQVLTTDSNYEHAGIFYKNLNNKKEKFQISHINEKHENQTIDFFNLAVSDFKCLDWKKIIKPKNQEELKKTFGEEWENIVQENYEKICSKFYTETNFKDIDNDQTYRELSILRPYYSFKENDSNHYVFDNRKMFCSEFVAMATDVTIRKLNEELNKNDALPKNMITSPFHKNTNFAAMHPGRLDRVLSKYTKPVEPLLILKHMVKLDLS